MVATDETHIGDAKLTPSEIAQAIRHKKYGVDMREAIAQAFEYMNSWWAQLKVINEEVQELFQKNKELNAKISDLENKHVQDIDRLQQQINEESGKRVEEVTRIEAEIQKNTSDINNLQVDLDNYSDRIKKIENAIFGEGTIELNYTSPQKMSNKLEEINTKKKGNY